MFQTGLLLLTGSLHCITESIGNYLRLASKNVIKRLYVKLEPEFNKPFSKSDTRSLSRLSKSIPFIYFNAAEICDNLDVRVLLPQFGSQKFEKSIFDVVLTNSSEDNQNIVQYMQQHFGNSCQNIVKVENTNAEECEQETENFSEYNVHQSVCMGGTFDRLHNGHKVLLSEAAMRTTQKLFVGISDGALLQRKVLPELIEPVHERIESVKEFLSDVDPSIRYDIAPILDPFGPTLTDPEIDCIVVSLETKPGGEKVNIERPKIGMNKLTMYVVDLVESRSHDVTEEAKISSTTVRKNLLGTLYKPGSLPDAGQPFRIHLTGPPTSGKSCITRILQSLGAEVISCDKEIHGFLQEQLVHEQKMELFADAGNVFCNDSLDYRKLTKALLKDQSKRQQFSSGVSDKIKEIVEKKFSNGVCKGASVILIQSSLLLDCNWKNKAHEVWSTVLPYRENIRRLQKCYEFTEEEAITILSTVPSNKENVQLANVIFSNQWTPNFTKKQVETAWSRLHLTQEK